MTTKRGLILLLTDKSDPWVLPYLQESHELVATDDLPGAVKTLHNIRYDLIMADDGFLRDQTLMVVEEIKRRFPTLPLLVLSDATDPDYQTQLIRAGVDDLLSMRLSKEELAAHVRLMLKQNEQNRALVERNQKLYMIASLTRLLETSDEPRLVILNAIHFISSLFGLRGIAVVLRERETFRLYAGNTVFIAKNQLFESVLHPGEHDPFLWTMRSRLLQVYEDISRNPNFVSIPIFPETTAAAIIPLVTSGDVIGAVGIFAPEIDNEDLFIYEQFAVQFAAGLRTAFQHQAQRLSLETNERLLDAWHAFANAAAPLDVAMALAQVVGDIPLVTRVVTWLFDDLYADNYNGQVVSELPRLRAQDVLYGLGYRADRENVPRTIAPGDAAVLQPILAALDTPQVTVLPIENVGLLFVSLVSGYELDTALVKHMVQIALYALQRIHLNQEILKNHARVMSVLVSINEGIFFVDERNRVVICNPQVTELTRVPTGQVVNQDSDVLLRAIAAETGAPDSTLAQLETARNRIRDTDDTDYPIVTVTLADGVELLIDFVKFLGDGEGVSWVGVVRPMSQPRPGDGLRLDALFERIPYAQTRSMLTTLSEQHGNLSYGDRQRLLEDIEVGVERIGRQWDNVIDLYGLQYGGLVIRREAVRFNELLERVISARTFNRVFRQISVDLPSTPIMVTGDEYALGRALTGLIQRALEASPAGVPIHIVVENGRDVLVTIEDMGAPMPPGQLESPEGENANVSVYIAGELIRRSGGHIYAGGGASQIGTSIRILLPTTDALPDAPPLIPAALLEGHVTTVLPPVATGAPQRELERIMLIKGRSKLAETLMDKLEEADYEVIDYTTEDEALPAVTEAHWDLIIIDAKLNERSGSDLCTRIRQRSEVPIILLSDEVTGQDKADGLNAGADDYISSPISHDELLARVRVIFNRRRIPDRTSEPLLMDNLYIDFAKRMVFLDNQPLELTRIEYDLLYTLVMNKGQTVTHKQLLSQVWGPEHQGETQYLWVNISRLRKKLEPTADSPRHIRTQPGVGYFFDAG
ncbi:MAG: response regulator [Chloroflexi bacterium]|nr:response regulator [Chloroflexota bacterium]